MEQPECELLFTGNEILIGKTLNTNGQWLARRLTSLGFKVKRFTVIEDDVEVIASTIKEILKRKPDLIIVSGGLGPTFDDKTLEGVAKGIMRPIKLNEEALKMVSKRYIELHKAGVAKDHELTDPRKKMAMLPEGAIPLSNPVGAAPGVLIHYGKTAIVCLPGVPKELKAIFEQHVIPVIKEYSKGLEFAEHELFIKGVLESDLSPMINEVMKNIPYVYIKSHPITYLNGSQIHVHLTSVGLKDTARKKVEEAVKLLKNKIKKIGGEILEEV
ncbi:MAG: molybdopterin-binding protein [Candidatus Odinarchaeia archaeon]